METTAAPTLQRQLSAAVEALAAVSSLVADYQAADDAALVELSHLAAQEKRLAEAHLALVAGEIAHRSTRELGHSGLAQREGFRSAEEFVRVTTGSTGREATTTVKVGRIVRDAATAGEVDATTGELQVSAEPWLAGVADAVSSGAISVGAADAIRSGLGSPVEGVTPDDLADAAAVLCGEAATLDVDRLLRRARELRDDLDEQGIADRERQRFEQRSLRHFRLANGMGRMVWDLDPENYAVVTELYDRATSPKRGVRFVDAERAEKAERIIADPRSIEQLASDTMLGLLQAGADADSTNLLGSGGAEVRVLVTLDALEIGVGHGRIEGSPDPVSLPTVERLACSGQTINITFAAEGNPLDVGREERFFTKRQKKAMAARDGACLFGTCDRPPSMTEAHHIKHWARDDGETNIDDGVVLCKFHHLLCHNNGWEVVRHGVEYFLIPPQSVDPDQTPRAMPSKSPAMRDLRRAVQRAGRKTA
jgi:hypothetical protein